MKTSISSKAFCSISDRKTDKIFTEQMLIYKGKSAHKRLERYLNQGPRKSRFSLNVVNGQTDGHTDGHTDFCFYRVALLLKMVSQGNKLEPEQTDTSHFVMWLLLLFNSESCRKNCSQYFCVSCLTICLYFLVSPKNLIERRHRCAILCS